MKKFFIGAGRGAVAVLAAAAIAAPMVSFAAYFNAGRMVNVGAAQAVDQNAYVAGASVAFAAPVTGDLLAAGGSVTISSKVTQDIMVAGGNVTIAGASAEDLRAVASNLTVESALSGELVAAGAQIMVTPDTTIAKDSYLRGSAITFDGTEAGNLDVAGNTVVIGGAVDGNLKIMARKVTIASGAVVRGNLDYTAPQPAAIAAGAQVMGATTFHQAAAASASAGLFDWLGPFAALFTLGLILKFLMVLFAAYLVWYIFRTDAIAIIEGAGRHFWKSVLRGFIFVVAVPAAVIVALITVVGVVAGVIAALAYAALMVLSFPVAVLVVSSFAMKRRSDLRWYHILLGGVIAAIAVLIPYIGWLAYLVVWLASTGSLLAVVGRKFARQG